MGELIAVAKSCECADGCDTGARHALESSCGPLFELTPARGCRCGFSHVDLSGEVDLSGVDQLSSALELIRLDGNSLLIIDVSRLGFLSATGLGVLARAARRYADAGGSLRLAGPSSMITRLLSVTGLKCLVIRELDGTRHTAAPSTRKERGE